MSAGTCECVWGVWVNRDGVMVDVGCVGCVGVVESGRWVNGSLYMVCVCLCA